MKFLKKWLDKAAWVIKKKSWAGMEDLGVLQFWRKEEESSRRAEMKCSTSWTRVEIQC